MSQNQKISNGNESEILIENSRPDIYKKNAFRISGLSILSTTAEITRQAKINEMRAKFGEENILNESPFALNPPPGEDEVSNALQKLKDPVTRIIDEFFWFWPHELENIESDEALKALTSNNVSKAQNIWISNENNLSISNVSIHNLAVLSHLLALDSELDQSGKASSVDKNRREADWKAAFKRWRALLRDEGFWNKLSDRIFQHNDARLKIGIVRIIRETLPVALLHINGVLAIGYCEKGEEAEARRHMELIKNSGFEKKDIDNALRRVIEPLKERIKIICKSAQEEAEKNSRYAHLPARRLISTSGDLLKVFDILLDNDNPIKETVYDEIALAILSCYYTYRNKTEDYTVSYELLKGAERIVKSSYNKQKINDAIKKLEELKRDNLIWCTEGYWELPDECITLLEECRELSDKKEDDRAIKKLTKGLMGIPSYPHHPNMYKIFKHCIAYCMQYKSVRVYNGSLNDYEIKSDKILQDSVPYFDFAVNSLLLEETTTYGPSALYCACHMNRITGTYYTRVIRGRKVPFCTSGNSLINIKLDKLREEMAPDIKEAYDLILLADNLAPGNPVISNNLKNIKESADVRKISKSDISELKKKFGLYTYHEIIDSLVSGGGSYEWRLFDSLKEIINANNAEYRKSIYRYLYDIVFKDEKITTKFFPFMLANEEIKEELVGRFFNPDDSSAIFKERQDSIINYFSKSKEYKQLYRIIEHLLYYESSGNRENILEKIITTVFESVYRLFTECDPKNISYTADKINELITPAAEFSPFLAERLLVNVQELLKHPPKNLNGNSKMLETTIKAKLISGALPA